jgi:pyruvate ferredoxin oxidoreductase delta subunit
MNIIKEGEYERLKGIPVIRERGNAVRRKTGSWRVFRPLINLSKCVKCKNCWLYCPDAAIKWKGKPVIDYRICKGCLICTSVCSSKAITTRKESEFIE